jgi:hypothetical protein
MVVNVEKILHLTAPLDQPRGMLVCRGSPVGHHCSNASIVSFYHNFEVLTKLSILAGSERAHEL